MPRTPAVDQECCISCEVCTQVCPDVFVMEGEEEGHGHDHAHGEHKSIVHNPFGAPEATIEEAMDRCPAACIYWVD
ncbi:MAG: ferredoxin [Desulfuromonas sp.]|nr:MAG: ferredoxin [Desulfuromonas sp.]